MQNKIIGCRIPNFNNIQLSNCKARTLYKSTDGPAGQHTDNPPNSDVSGDFQQTMPEMTVQVYWQPGRPIFQPFSSDPDPDPMWQSGTVAHTILWLASTELAKSILSADIESGGVQTHFYTGKNDLKRHVTYREADFGMLIHSIFDAWHYEGLWTYVLTRLLWYTCDFVRWILYITLHTIHHTAYYTHAAYNKLECKLPDALHCTLPGTHWSKLLIALDCTLPACLNVRSQLP